MIKCFYETKFSFLCTPIDIVIIFFASASFSEKCMLGGVTGGGSFFAPMCVFSEKWRDRRGILFCVHVRLRLLASNAFMYTTDTGYTIR